MVRESCPYKPRKVLTEKQAEKEPVGSFYHPSENRYRSGACPEGFSLKKGYMRKSFTKEDGTVVNETYVDPICIKNRGLPGKLMTSHKTIKLSERNSFKPYGYSTKNNSNTRYQSLLEAVKELTYSTVIHRLSALRTFHKNSDEEVNKKLYNKFNQDIKKLQGWRQEHPTLYIHKTNNSGARNLNNSVITNSNNSPVVNANNSNIKNLNSVVTNNGKIAKENLNNYIVTNNDKIVKATTNNSVVTNNGKNSKINSNKTVITNMKIVKLNPNKIVQSNANNTVIPSSVTINPNMKNISIYNSNSNSNNSNNNSNSNNNKK